MKNNYFIEGLQGAGKSTFVQRLSDSLKDYKVFREGDFSPVELAWCAWVTKIQYQDIQKKYPALQEKIKEKTFSEDDHRIICYTQIITDEPGFHKNMEQYEIYNGNLDKKSFEQIILDRYKKWNGIGQIFECSIFQNILDNQMLYLMWPDNEIMDFYRRLKDVLSKKTYKIIYLDVDDIAEGIRMIRKERCDDNGNEMWFPLMIKYLEESPFGKEHALAGREGWLYTLTGERPLNTGLSGRFSGITRLLLRQKTTGWTRLWNSCRRIIKSGASCMFQQEPSSNCFTVFT